MMTDEQTAKSFAKVVLVVLLSFATLFVVTGAALTMLLH
jgi:hypothetical protein